MKLVRNIIKLHSDMGLSIRKIEGATGVAKSTVADYIKRFDKSGLSMKQINLMDDDTLRSHLLLNVSTTIKVNTIKTTDRVLPDYNYIHQELKRYGGI